jgi:transcriptional regulator with GAF, ATPase, and Fis domain
MPVSDLVGSSEQFRAVLNLVNMVAPVDSAVLVRGETGTGKEVIAQAIHDASPRRNNRFVAINCAAIPAALLESELFGHERGAFTGAVSQRIGRFQSADRGTIFLDEIGDLPLELQPKLLRVLQEQEVEPLGGTRTVRVNVRVIAATNQDLEAMVEERKFRADLYYRLNIFPINLPSLREREEDIPLLVAYFVRKFSERVGKSIDCVPDDVMEALQRHHWPGNIRELQNFIERSLIMATGSVLRPNLEELSPPQAARFVRTLADAERAHILETLRQTNGVVGGADGAATRLGLPRTTLLAKMQNSAFHGRLIKAARLPTMVTGPGERVPRSPRAESDLLPLRTQRDDSGANRMLRKSSKASTDRWDRRFRLSKDFFSILLRRDIHHDHRRIVELLRPGRPFRHGLDDCAGIGRAAAALHQAILAKLLLRDVLGIGGAIGENH